MRRSLRFLRRKKSSAARVSLGFFGLCAGDPAAALRLSSQLMSLGADVSLRSRWTNMNALHYAAYFDVPELVRVLLKAAKPRGRLATDNSGSASCRLNSFPLTLRGSSELHVQ